jgi:hypothetical protein
MGAATSDDQTLNCRTTSATQFTCALIDIKTLLHLAVAIRCRVVINRGAAGVNRFAEYANDCMVEALNLRWAHFVRRGERMDLCAPE